MQGSDQIQNKGRIHENWKNLSSESKIFQSDIFIFTKKVSLNGTQDYPSSTFMDSYKLRSNVSVELCLSRTTPLIWREYFYFRLFWILFWLFGIIYTGYAVYQDTNHYLDYPSMILRKEESLGEFYNYGDFDH